MPVTLWLASASLPGSSRVLPAPARAASRGATAVLFSLASTNAGHRNGSLPIVSIPKFLRSEDTPMLPLPVRLTFLPNSFSLQHPRCAHFRSESSRSSIFSDIIIIRRHHR